MSIINWNPIDTAPYDIPVYLLFEGNVIHTGMKTKEEWFMYRGTAKEVHGFSEKFEPHWVYADYESETYFCTNPTSWAPIEQ